MLSNSIVSKTIATNRISYLPVFCVVNVTYRILKSVTNISNIQYHLIVFNEAISDSPVAGLRATKSIFLKNHFIAFVSFCKAMGSLNTL